MRLLMTTDTMGGVWTFTKELTAGLLHLGCRVVLVSFGRTPSVAQLADVERLNRMGSFQFVASQIPLEWMDENAAAYSAAEPLLLQLCREFCPDALLLSQFCFGALPVPVPKIVVAHSDVLSWAEATGKAPLADDGWLRTYAHLVQQGLRKAALVIAPTGSALRSLAFHFHLPGGTAVVHNGRSVPTVKFAAPRKLCAISAGRMWDPAKNLELLNSIDAKMPLLIAGDNDNVTRSDRNITLLAHKNEDDLLTLFRESAIYICASRYEPFGLAALEAALCGCAVLANDISSLREVWGDAALYFSNASSLGALLHQLAEDPLRLANVQQACGARARRFGAKRMTEAYFEHIQGAIARASEEQPCAA